MSESEAEYPEPDPTLSSDARWATYEEAPRDDDEYPPSGTATIQTKGRPQETTETTTRRTRSSSTASSKES